jgi:hypothetical protein
MYDVCDGDRCVLVEREGRCGQKLFKKKEPKSGS